MYTTKNFMTKKALKEAVASGERVTYFQPGPFEGNEPLDGTITLEGPHYPRPHKWYARARVEHGQITKILS